MSAPIPGADVYWSFGILRMEERLKPYLHTNAGHAGAGMLGVRNYKPTPDYPGWQYLEVLLQRAPVPTSVAWFTAAPDETAVKHGITCGASGGNSNLVLAFAIDGREVPVSDPRLWMPGLNFNLAVASLVKPEEVPS